MKKIGGNRKKKKKWRKSIIIENIENIKKKQKETKKHQTSSSNIIVKLRTQPQLHLQQIYTNYTKKHIKISNCIIISNYFLTL